MHPRASLSSDARERATSTSRLDASASLRALASSSAAAAPDATRAAMGSGAGASSTGTASMGAPSRSGSAGSLVGGSAARSRFAGRRRQPASSRGGWQFFGSRHRRVLLLFVAAIAGLAAMNVLLLRSPNSIRAADLRYRNNEDLSAESEPRGSSDEVDDEGADNEESDSEDRRNGDSSWSWLWRSVLGGKRGGQRRARELKAFNNSDPEPDAGISGADEQFIDATLPVHGAQGLAARKGGNAGAAVGAGGAGAGGGGARVRLEDVLRFNVMGAGRRWDRRVGCSKFRAKHNASVHAWRPSDWHPPSPSLQATINPAHCSNLKLPHVTVRVANSTWLQDTIIEGMHACHPCPLSCAFTRARPLATHPDALLFEGVLPPNPSKPGHPLHVYMNLEADPWGEGGGGTAGEGGNVKEGEKGKEGKEGSGGEGAGARAAVDVWVGYSANATVQATYAGHLFHWDRQRYIADNKRTDVPVFHAVSSFVPWRDAVVKALMKQLPLHSFGSCRNNMAEHGAELQLYPHCAHTYGAGERWHHHTHCVQSHYLFALAVENTRAPGYVTEKFFYPLEAGTVPIYIGAPDIAAFAPPDSYIDASGLSPAEVGALVKRIAADPLEYMGYHAWRRCGVLGNYSRARQVSLDSLPCRLCEQVSRMGGTQYPRP
ncbi:hypothetical protein CLOM_g8426 [Closterium sp. NIES-68]|nr:hypothetical protein CLOM_g8426 [Closterium sp. NIES-68]GJP79959.1 hypothetical protein CLOP_g10188 [Closterium sp. NIES-67]